MKNSRLHLAAAMGLSLLLAACQNPTSATNSNATNSSFVNGSQAVSYTDVQTLQKDFMNSYYASSGGTQLGVAKALTPFLPQTSAPSSARATVPVGNSSIKSWKFSDLVANTQNNPSANTLTDYPETGQSTTFTVVPLSSNTSTLAIYDITATTTFPTTDTRQSYVEEYYVQDVGLNPATGYDSASTPDGLWTTADPIVQPNIGPASNGGWGQNQDYRLKMHLTFRDGTTRDEQIVSDSNPSSSGVIFGQAPTVGGPKFASFDVSSTASLDMAQQFVPAASTDPTINYSSVVVYETHPATNPNFWFWQGSTSQTIVGIRYYTEQYVNSGTTLNATSVSFEKTLSNYTGTGGTYSKTLTQLQGGSSFETLAESVLREETSWPIVNSQPDFSQATVTKYMQTRVINVSGQQDFYLQQLNTDYVNLSGWAAGTLYTVPTANVDASTSSDPSALLFTRNALTTGTAGALPLVSPTVVSGSTFLAQVYTSIVEGAATIPASTATPPTNLTGTSSSSSVYSFNGQRVVGSSSPNVSSFNLGKSGMVEAWVYLNKLTNTMGIVHYGTKVDFSDEGYSLQGWNGNGQVTMVVDSSPNTYDQVLSTKKLRLNTWYYLVGVWDVTNGNHYLRLYINGALNNSTTTLPAINPYGSQAANETSSVMIGSQLPASYSSQLGYFGVDGKITGVMISNPYTNSAVTNMGDPTSTATIDNYVASVYSQYKNLTSGW